MKIEINILSNFIEFLGFNLCLCLCFFKSLNIYPQLTINKKLIVLITSILLSIVRSLIKYYIPPLIFNIPLIIIYSILFSKLCNIETQKSLSTFAICIAITYALYYMSIFIVALIYATLMKILNWKYFEFISVIILSILNIVSVHLLFKLKRLKYGLSFLKNEYLNLLILWLTIIIIFLYSFGYKYNLNTKYSINYWFCIFFLIFFISFVIIKHSFILYQKQKIQTQTLKDYEKELCETKQKLQTALEEKEKIIKSNHEFYHRQEALKNKLNTLAKSSFNTEISEEISALNKRLNNLNNEYKSKTQILTNLTSTGITEIDDMLSYFQRECYDNNIEFIFKLDCNIHNIVNKLITTSELETLLGDLLRNSIIAINHTSNEFRSIMLVFGISNNTYTIDIFDSGIPFEINTLLNLGLQKCSTHLNEGGTGIGFITTFETLNKNKCSFTITEYDSSSYSKCLSIMFDNLQNYIINSYRINEIKSNNKINRNITFQNNHKK